MLTQNFVKHIRRNEEIYNWLRKPKEKSSGANLFFEVYGKRFEFGNRFVWRGQEDSVFYEEVKDSAEFRIVPLVAEKVEKATMEKGTLYGHR